MTLVLLVLLLECNTHLGEGLDDDGLSSTIYSTLTESTDEMAALQVKVHM